MAPLNIMPAYDGNHGITAESFLKAKAYVQENQGDVNNNKILSLTSISHIVSTIRGKANNNKKFKYVASISHIVSTIDIEACSHDPGRMGNLH